MPERTNLTRSPSLRRLLMTRHTTIPPEMSWLHFSWSSVHGNAQIGFNQSVAYQVSWEFVNLRGKACGWVPVWEFGVVGGHWQGYLESCLLSSRRCGLIIREGECLEGEAAWRTGFSDPADSSYCYFPPHGNCFIFEISTRVESMYVMSL